MTTSLSLTGGPAMKAVVVEQPGSVCVREVPDPEVGPNDVLIRVAVCGICGSDIHIIDGEFPPTVYPIVPGHEFAGTVEAVGELVNGIEAGDRVGVDPTLNCEECFFCQRGQGNLCERWNAVGVGEAWGAFAEFVSAPARTVYPLPDDMSFKTAALIEPVACVVHGFHLLQPKPGDTWCIYGAGPMGLQNAQIARFYGASAVAIVDVNPKRQEIARSFGFEVVGSSLEEVRYGAPRGFDNVIDATGKTKVAERAIDAVIRRGKLLIFGVCPPEETAAYNAFKIYNQEITIIGTMAILNSYGPAIDVLQAGAIDTGKMVTHTFPLDQFEEAVALVRRGEGLKGQPDLHLQPLTPPNQRHGLLELIQGKGVGDHLSGVDGPGLEHIDGRAVAVQNGHCADNRDLLVVDLERVVCSRFLWRADSENEQLAPPDDCIDGPFGNLRLACGVDDVIESARRAISNLLQRRTHDLKAERAGDLLAFGIDVDNRHRAGAIEPGDLGILQTHRTSPVDAPGIARFRLEQVKAMHHTRNRLDQRSGLERHVIWQRINRASRRRNEFRERSPGLADANRVPPLAEVALSALAEKTFLAIERRIDPDTITGFDTVHQLADRLNGPCKLMPRHDWID